MSLHEWSLDRGGGRRGGEPNPTGRGRSNLRPQLLEGDGQTLQVRPPLRKSAERKPAFGLAIPRLLQFCPFARGSVKEQQGIGAGKGAPVYSLLLCSIIPGRCAFSYSAPPPSPRKQPASMPAAGMEAGRLNTTWMGTRVGPGQPNIRPHIGWTGMEEGG